MYRHGAFLLRGWKFDCEIIDPMNAVKPSAYVDTCVLSHLFDKGPAAPSQDMLDALEKIADDPGIDLVTSAKTLEEIAKDPDQVRRVNSKLLFRLLTKVEPGPTMYPGPAVLGGVMFGGGTAMVDDPLVVGLRKIFPDEPDVEHIFHATKNGCTYFVTIDRSTILNKAAANQAAVATLCPGLTFLSPVDLAKTLP
jgi:hypothetical protein